jgi:hypothetical protein
VSDREFFDILRKRAERLCRDALHSLDASKTPDGKMAPHVAKDRVEKLAVLAEKLSAMAQLAKVLP